MCNQLPYPVSRVCLGYVNAGPPYARSVNPAFLCATCLKTAACYTSMEVNPNEQQT